MSKLKRLRQRHQSKFNDIRFGGFYFWNAGMSGRFINRPGRSPTSRASAATRPKTPRFAPNLRMGKEKTTRRIGRIAVQRTDGVGDARQLYLATGLRPMSISVRSKHSRWATSSSWTTIEPQSAVASRRRQGCCITLLFGPTPARSSNPENVLSNLKGFSQGQRVNRSPRPISRPLPGGMRAGLTRLCYQTHPE